MPSFIDITGKKFNRWTAIERTGASSGGTAMWTCRCDCGTIREVIVSGLRNGKSKSCGCLTVDSATKHGMEKTRLYSIHHGLKSRCTNKNLREYKSYGGRGITYCQVWESFSSFAEWALSNGYEDHLQIDRIDSNGNYEPSNCRWVTGKQNCNNRRNNVTITIEGVTKTQSQWAEEHGLLPQTIYQRIKQGWSEKDLIKPKRVKK